MTDQKPENRSWEDWVEEQIQEAQREGHFDRLEGRGRPIPGLLEPYDPLWWVKKLIEREKLSMLPAALEIRARVDRALQGLWQCAGETQVRDLVAGINVEIARVNRSTAEGPPTSLPALDPEAIVAEWRRRRTGG
ncbi:MAG TPA: DUF1992 domain-containing protein [Methylomirabilota bacterium]|nr:DUF1992 domain-containing protein [Methylomirabilota bacterium]